MYDFFKTLALPPFNLIAALAAGLVLITIGRKRLGYGLAWASLFLFYAMSTDQAGNRLMRLTENVPVLSPSDLGAVKADAIVILSASANPLAAEFGVAKPGFRSLARVRYGAYVHRRTGLPILISGGPLKHSPETISRIMADDLQDSFGVHTTWLEERSTNTFENAAFSAEILRDSGLTRIVLITEAFHMQRALNAFAPTGLSVVPAPTVFTRSPKFGLISILPTLRGLTDSHYALHELLGRLWYRLRYRIFD